MKNILVLVAVLLLVLLSPATLTAQNQTVTQPVQITVDPATLALTVPATIPHAKVGVAYSLQLTIVGGKSPFTVTSTGLPVGMSVDNTAKISGTATATCAPCSASVTVVDSSGSTASINLQWVPSVSNTVTAQSVRHGLSTTLTEIARLNDNVTNIYVDHQPRVSGTHHKYAVAAIAGTQEALSNVVDVVIP